MERYKNLSGNSGVLAFEIHEDSIIVQFNTSAIYLYNYYKPGVTNVEAMKSIAKSGKGLSSYISKYVNKRYAARLK